MSEEDRVMYVYACVENYQGTQVRDGCVRIHRRSYVHED